MEPGIYNKGGNLIKSYEDLAKEGFNIEQDFYHEHEIDSAPSSAHNLFKKYKPAKLVLPDNAEIIGQEALCRCDSIEEIVIGKNIKEIAPYAFLKCSNLRKIVFNDKLEKLDFAAFKRCENLESVNFPSSLLSIADEVFTSCDKLKTIPIPPLVDFVTENTFRYCSNLEKIEVDSKNIKYCSEDGVLFSKNKKELLIYPAGKTDKIYKVPNEVKKICAVAFASNKYVSEVQLPDKLEYIGREAFLKSNLRKIYLPDSLEELEYHSFSNCYHLKEVRLPDNVKVDYHNFINTYELKEINVSKTFVKNHPEFVEKFKDKIKIVKSLDELLEEGASFKEINKKFKNNDMEK